MSSFEAYTFPSIASITYGAGSLSQLPQLLRTILSLPDSAPIPKTLVITGNSIATKTPLVREIKDLLGDSLAGCFSNIGEHAPVKGIEEAMELVGKERVEALIGLGGGSPIDSAKTMGFFNQQRNGKFLPQIAIPTTLSAAEFTMTAGFTTAEGQKSGVKDISLFPKAIILDPQVTVHTPPKLWLSSGMRTLDHAIEQTYRLGAQIPLIHLALAAMEDIFVYLPRCKDEEKTGKPDLEARERVQIAAWMSLFPNIVPAPIGLSHALGHRLGATYGIPHGITSVLTLGPTVSLLYQSDCLSARAKHWLALGHVRIPAEFKSLDSTASSEDEKALDVANAIGKLVSRLGLETRASDYGVKEEDMKSVGEGAVKNLTGSPYPWGGTGEEGRLPPPEEVVKMLVQQVL